MRFRPRGSGLSVVVAALCRVTSLRKGWLEIGFSNTGIIVLPGKLLINPAHAFEFIQALRTHAPHARFTIGRQAA